MSVKTNNGFIKRLKNSSWFYKDQDPGYDRIVLYSPAIGTINMGDHIIVNSVKHEIDNIIDSAFVVEISTHFPLSLYLRLIKYADYRFVCGSNLLSSKMNRPFSQWDIGFSDLYAGPCILIGAGWKSYEPKPNLYTRMLLRKILSKDFIHSVRDSYTEKQLKSIGIKNVINTGCPTMWCLTKQHCNEIPKTKAIDVVATITDYRWDEDRDSKLLDILCKNYRTVYLWQQGIRDGEYFARMNIKNRNIELIPPSLSAYDRILDADVDYVGTRLHAGIRALQKKKRTIIIAIDNRAKEKQRDFNLKCVQCENLQDLEKEINSDFSTDIEIPVENIEKWKKQFICK